MTKEIDEAPNKLPPQDLEAEQATLGACLVEPDAAGVAFAICEPSDFYREVHRIIAQAILTLHRRDEVADLITVGAELRRLEQLEDVGGGEYLTALIGNVPTSKHIAQYAEIVAKKAILRKAAALGEQLTGGAYKDPQDLGAFLDEHRVRYEQLYRTRITPQPQPGAARDLETGRELLDDPEPEPVWLVQGILARGNLGILAGRGKTGKSFLGLQLAQAVAAGGFFFGRQCQQGNVVYAALEDGRGRIGRRLKAQGAQPEVVEHIRFRYARQWTPIDTENGIGHLEQLRKATKPDLIIIDTLVSAKTGKLDENVAGEVAELMNRIHLWAEETDTAVLFLYHHHKLATGDVVLDLRGSTAFGGAADVIMGLYRDKRKHECGFVVEGRDIDDLHLVLTWDKDRLLWNTEGDMDKVPATKSERNALLALEQLARPVTAARVAEELDITRQSAQPALESLVDKGIIHRSEERAVKGSRGGKAKVLYALVEVSNPEQQLDDFADTGTYEGE